MSEHQTDLPLDAPYAPAPAAPPELRDEIAATWGLPIGERIEVAFHRGELDAIAQPLGGFADGSVSHAQAAAFAMAVFFRDMTLAERVALTEAMRDSGKVLDWSGLDGPVVDKHSTGGVGDNVSLMLGPILASLHNLAYMHRLMREIRAAIAGDRFESFRSSALARLAGAAA